MMSPERPDTPAPQEDEAAASPRGLDLVRLRCEPRPDGLCALLASWPFWATAVALAVATLVATHGPRRLLRLR